VAKGQSIEPSNNDRTGLSAFDGVLIIGGGIIAIAIAVSFLGFLAAVVWTVIKLIEVFSSRTHTARCAG
jgi:hypothetical protein